MRWWWWGGSGLSTAVRLAGGWDRRELTPSAFPSLGMRENLGAFLFSQSLLVVEDAWCLRLSGL